MTDGDLWARPSDQALVSGQAASRLDPSGFDPSRGYAAALPHLRAARVAYLAAISGLQNPCDEIFSHKWLDPVCVGHGCRSLLLKRAVNLLSQLAFMARTSGGTAGPDTGLMQACDAAENFLVSLRGPKASPKHSRSNPQ